MKILVAGRQGQVAQALAHARATPGTEVVCAGRPDLDLTKPGSLDGALEREKPAVVINAAAYTAVDKAEAEEAAAFAINAAGAENLARACASRGVPLIHLSTDYVFDGEKTSPYVEADATGPINAYGRSKLEGEQRVAASVREHIIVRTSWVVSPWGQNFVKTMLRLAETREEIGVVADQVGTPTYAPHLADMLIELSGKIAAKNQPREAWGIFHAAGAGAASWHMLAGQVFREAERRGARTPQVNAIATSAYPTPARRPMNSRLDCSKLAHTHGFALPDWQSGISDCITLLVGHSTNSSSKP